MTIMNSAQFVDAVEPFLSRAFDESYKRFPAEYSEVFNVETAQPYRFEEDYLLSGLGVAAEKPEGTAVAYDEGQIAYRVRYTHRSYGLAYAMTEELREDGDGAKLGQMMAEQLGMAMAETQELVAVDILNKAETSGYLGGDNVTLLNTAHPLSGGGTWSNKLATPADLSEASLELLCIQVRKAKDERSKPIRLNVKKVIVAPDQQFNALRILRTTMRTGTTDNDISALRAASVVPTDPFVMTRLTLTNAYFLQTDAPRGLVFKNRRSIKRGMEGDFETDSMRFKATMRFSVGYTNPRCVYGSLGV